MGIDKEKIDEMRNTLDERTMRLLFSGLTETPHLKDFVTSYFTQESKLPTTPEEQLKLVQGAN
mgnify:CR=1 FL=1